MGEPLIGGAWPTVGFASAQWHIAMAQALEGVERTAEQVDPLRSKCPDCNDPWVRHAEGCGEWRCSGDFLRCPCKATPPHHAT